MVVKLLFNKSVSIFYYQLRMVLSFNNEFLANESGLSTDPNETGATSAVNEAEASSEASEDHAPAAGVAQRRAQRWDERQHGFKDTDRTITVVITINTADGLSFVFNFVYRKSEYNESLIEQFCDTLYSMLEAGLTDDDAVLIDHVTRGYQVCGDLVNVAGVR